MESTVKEMRESVRQGIAVYNKEAVEAIKTHDWLRLEECDRVCRVLGKALVQLNLQGDDEIAVINL